MVFLALGFLSFALFVLYDVQSVLPSLGVFRYGFFAGCGLLAIAYAGLWVSALRQGAAHSFTLFFSILAGLSLAGLIYTLFFALPFEKTYVEQDTLPPVCSIGLYGLCRHPGWYPFACLCLFGYLALPTCYTLAGGLLFPALNFGYIVFQDCWTFPRTFRDYSSYRRQVPFLLPNRKSIQRCRATWDRRDGS